MDITPDALLRQVRDRDTEIWVLVQRTRLLNNSAFKSRIVDDNGLETPGGMGSFGALKKRLTALCGCQEKVIDYMLYFQRRDSRSRITNVPMHSCTAPVQLGTAVFSKAPQIYYLQNIKACA